MDDARLAGRRIPRLAATGRCLLAILPLAALAAAVGAAPKTTTFVHSVGFSFDYPAKWQLQRVQEGMMLIPHTGARDSAGRPMELVIIGFVDTGGVTDPFEPSFVDAFERRYREIVPSLARHGDADWLRGPLGTGLLVPFTDDRGNPHRLYCAVHGDLGIFLSHVAQRGAARPATARVKEVFSSFGWNETAVDPALVRSWTQADLAGSPGPGADRWTFATDGRLRRATGFGGGGFYSSSDGVLNILWDHGLEESYLYEVSRAGDDGRRLELRHPDGGELRFVDRSSAIVTNPVSRER